MIRMMMMMMIRYKSMDDENPAQWWVVELQNIKLAFASTEDSQPKPAFNFRMLFLLNKWSSMSLMCLGHLQWKKYQQTKDLMYHFHLQNLEPGPSTFVRRDQWCVVQPSHQHVVESILHTSTGGGGGGGGGLGFALSNLLFCVWKIWRRRVQ